MKFEKEIWYKKQLRDASPSHYISFLGTPERQTLISSDNMPVLIIISCNCRNRQRYQQFIGHLPRQIIN